MRKPLSAEWRQIICRWAEPWERITAVYVFGSRARGWSDKWMRPPTSESDIDIAVELSESDDETAFSYFMHERPAMLAALEPHLPCSVDLQLVDDANVMVTPELVRRTGKLVFQR